MTHDLGSHPVQSEGAAAGVARTTRVIADLIRLATLLSGVAALVFFGGQGAISFFVLFAVLLLPRWLDVAHPFDMVFCATMLVAAWARQQHWYATVFWVDEAVHAVTPGAAAVATYLMLAKLELLPDVYEQIRATRRFSLVLLVTIIGLGLAAVWEFWEWIGEQVAPKSTLVGYDDTISDMALGGAGALVLGVLLLVWFRIRPRGADSSAH
ncbi:MAG TPA: hypothetical protein VFG88_10855 [Nocardioidaceae bacterium]|jgi:hypothetical protein|nr:hypothetical protein [Nocardioidaceae bacterium]